MAAAPTSSLPARAFQHHAAGHLPASPSAPPDARWRGHRSRQRPALSLASAVALVPARRCLLERLSPRVGARYGRVTLVSDPLPLSVLPEPFVPVICGPACPHSTFSPRTLSFPFVELDADPSPARICFRRLSGLSSGTALSLPSPPSPQAARMHGGQFLPICSITPFISQHTRQPRTERYLALHLHGDWLLSPKACSTLSVESVPARASVGRSPGAAPTSHARPKPSAARPLPRMRSGELRVTHEPDVCSSLSLSFRPSHCLPPEPGTVGTRGHGDVFRRWRVSLSSQPSAWRAHVQP